MNVLITGVAGFVGTNLAKALLDLGHSVLGFDNLSLGSMQNLALCQPHRRFSWQRVDLSDLEGYRAALLTHHQRAVIDEVWHLAASSDISEGASNPMLDLRDTFMTTFNTLLLMKELGIRRIVFSSSSAIYGDHGDRLLSEDTGPLFPISNYGAMKLASEATISSALESSIDRAWIFRFPNVIGVPATHGVIFDFVRRLKNDRKRLVVLGDGTQQKSYLHIDDLVGAMLYAHAHSAGTLSYFNIGPEDPGVTVAFIAQKVVDAIAPGAIISFGFGKKGWPGDVPRFRYSVRKIMDLGWRPIMGSAAAVSKAITQIAAQEGAA